MKKAVQFGAGNIGRGFIGAVLAQAGWQVIFADVVKNIVDAINDKRKYTVHVLDEKKFDLEISGVSAVDSSSDDVLEAIASADLITTAVGLNILPRIAGTLASGIRFRMKKGIESPLDIIACENGIGASALFKEEVGRHLDEAEFAYMQKFVGFANCSVDRIVPPVRCENPIDVCVENFYEWNVDRKSLKGDLKGIGGMNLVDNLDAYVERKLFTLNTAHAISAYLGWLKGFKTVSESVENPEIAAIVRGAMEESGKALIKKYALDENVHSQYIEKILKRFKNPHIVDEVERVAREPMRKLSGNDRLVKPALTAISYDIAVPNLIKGMAAALRYDNPSDIQSLEMQKLIKLEGVKRAFCEISGVDNEALIDALIFEYEKL